MTYNSMKYEFDTKVRFFTDKGVFQMRTSALFWCKNIGFFKIFGVSARTRGRGREVEASADILRTGGRSIFRDFVRTSFMDEPYRILYRFKRLNSNLMFFFGSTNADIKSQERSNACQLLRKRINISAIYCSWRTEIL